MESRTMAQTEIIKCHHCGRDVSAGNSYFISSKIICEDCYLNRTFHVQACDPLAVRSAEKFRKMSGTDTIKSLTGQQKAIYEYIKSKGKITSGELLAFFHIPDKELENQLAILRHCSLIKAFKESGHIYFTPF